MTLSKILHDEILHACNIYVINLRRRVCGINHMYVQKPNDEVNLTLKMMQAKTSYRYEGYFKTRHQ